MEGADVMTEAKPTIRDDMAAFDAVRSELEAAHLGCWVLFHDRHLVGAYNSFEEAAQEAVQKFGRGPYLIRQVGAASVTLPASVMYGPLHAINVMRI
jgi:hypothetical protein